MCNVPVIMGTTAEEGSLFMPMLLFDAERSSIDFDGAFIILPHMPDVPNWPRFSSSSPVDEDVDAVAAAGDVREAAIQPTTGVGFFLTLRIRTALDARSPPRACRRNAS